MSGVCSGNISRAGATSPGVARTSSSVIVLHGVLAPEQIAEVEKVRRDSIDHKKGLQAPQEKEYGDDSYRMSISLVA